MTELDQLVLDTETPDEQSKPRKPEDKPIFEQLHELSEEEKEALLTDTFHRFKDSLQYMGKIWPKMIEHYKKYRGIVDPIVDEDGAERLDEPNLHIPYTYAMVESAMPRLAGKLPRTRAFPRNKESRAKAEVIQDTVYYSLDRANWLQKQIMWIRQSEMYGWSPLYYFWHYEETNSYARVQDPLTKEWFVKKVPVISWDDWDCRVLDAFDSFLQPGVPTPAGGDWFMFREWISKRDIEQKVKDGYFYPEVQKYMEDNPHPSNKLSADDGGRAERDALAGFIKDISETAYGKYELIYMLEKDRVVTMLNREIIASSGDNPHPKQIIPIVNCTLTEQINEPIGIGSIEPIIGLQDKLNALSNARLKNIALMLEKVFFADRNSQTDFKNLRMSAGNIIPTNNIESVVPWEVPDLSKSSQDEIDITKDDIQFALGISDYHNVGGEGPGTETATGISTIVREGNARFALKLAAFEALPLREVIEAIHAYNMLYMPVEKSIRILGPRGWVMQDITVEDILCECDFIVEPGSSVPLDQLARREALVTLLDRMITLPQVVDIYQYVKEVLEAHDIRHPEDMMIERAEEYSQYNDVRLAEAENTAIAQGQDIQLKGMDEIHMQSHFVPIQNGEFSGWSQEAQAKLMEHIQGHQMRIQQRMQYAAQISTNNLFGGGNGNQGTSGTPTAEQGGGGGVAQPVSRGGAGAVQPDQGGYQLPDQSGAGAGGY